MGSAIVCGVTGEAVFVLGLGRGTRGCVGSLLPNTNISGGSGCGATGGGMLGVTVGGFGFWSGIGNVGFCLGAGGRTAFNSNGRGGGGHVGMGAAGGGPAGGGIGGIIIGGADLIGGGLVDTARQGCRGTEPDRSTSGAAFTGRLSPVTRFS